ncbi:MAG: hypothetical protein PHH49_05260 [Candidatus Omnitrophica bacterium]|nr:hypothetical protein [Candidatus Omnitrophota bacterium]MDD5488350.1 hypothetical protein [Candidatus Omnitrophota bacterium]
MCALKKIPVRVAYGVFILVVTAVFSLGSGCSSKPSGEEVVVRINDYPLSAAEFTEMFSQAGFPEDTPASRESFLETLINRKLILQEGVKENLDKQKPFLDAIQNFWEQSLLKIVIEAKMREVATQLSVSDQEVEDFYAKWIKANPENTKTLDELRDVIRWQLMREKQSILLETWIQSLKNKANIQVDRKAIGVE